MEKLTLGQVKERMPQFMEICEETFKGFNRLCKFIDKKYGDFIIQTPRNVFYSKSVTPKRKRAERMRNGYNGQKGCPITLEEFKKKLPKHIEIYEETWKSYTEKAKFRDIEYNSDFEARPHNINKTNCKQRSILSFRKKQGLSEDQINKRLDKIYGFGFCKIIFATYKNVDSIADFHLRDKNIVVKAYPSGVFQGWLGANRAKHKIFKQEVLDKFGKKCFVSNSDKQIHIHHIYPKHIYDKLKFEQLNGIPLCQDIHMEFHNKYGRKACFSEFLEFCKSHKLSEDKIKILEEIGIKLKASYPTN